MKTVRITWDELHKYEATLKVPDDFDASVYDLHDGLGSVSDPEHFVDLTRDNIVIEDVADNPRADEINFETVRERHRGSGPPRLLSEGS